MMVDRAVAPHSGYVVVAVVDGDFVCKTLYQRAGRIKLKAANVILLPAGLVCLGTSEASRIRAA